MALNNRPIQPKSPKIKNNQLTANYRRNNPACELCRMEGLYNITGVELHHIQPGQGRTDKVWNIIMICQRHHREVTEHVHGNTVRDKNCFCIALKVLKHEMGYDRAYEIAEVAKVNAAVDLIRPFYEKAGKQ